jgi:DNA-binding NarL/FixJ family response regulator
MKKALPSFSIREIQIIRLICKEYLSHEIAEVLRISTRTVEQHRDNIKKKMNAKNGVGIAIFAIKQGLYKI